MEARLRRIFKQHGISPAAARNLQAAIVQVTMLYASELTWNGKSGVEDEYQLAINRMRSRWELSRPHHAASS